MKLAQLCVDRPVSTIVAVLLLALFGIISMFRLPVQMKPTVDKPIIRIQTTYWGAAPPEIEEQITDKIEEKVNAVQGLKKLSSSSSDSFSNIEMEFEWGVDRDARFVDVLQKVSQIGTLPEDADKPVIAAISSVDEERIMWLAVQSDSLSVEEMTRIVRKEVKAALERVEGVGVVDLFGGREREIWVCLDPHAMAIRMISVDMVRQAILRENQNVRGGYIDEGKLRYNIRTMGQFKTVSDMESMVVTRNAYGTVYLKEIARVVDTYERVQSVVRGKAKPMIALGVARKLGANVVQVADALKAEIVKLNHRFAGIVYKGRAASIRIEVAYDESTYILESVDFVYDNLLMGALLAAGVLIFFLKSLRAMFIISVVIPICFIAVFIFLEIFGRTLNIISLAGIAFAVGMTVDNAIVVLENIYRHMEMGKDRHQACIDGTTEVWGAVLASTLTTMAVFLPILYSKEEAGELFKDIALAISCSVGISLVVAITVTPMMAAHLLPRNHQKDANHKLITWLFWIPDKIGEATGGLLIFLSDLATGKYLPQVRDWTRWILGVGLNGTHWLFRVGLKLSIVVVIGVAAVAITVTHKPALEYLPTGNRNIIVVIYKFHAGTNVEKASAICLEMEKKILNILFDPARGDVENNHIVRTMFSVTGVYFNIIGVIVPEAQARAPLASLPIKINPMTQRPFQSPLDYIAFCIGGAVYGTPGTEYAFAIKPGLFNFTSKTFQIEVRGPDIRKIEALANDIEARLQKINEEKGLGLGRAIKQFDAALPEIRVHIDRERAADLGLKTSEVAAIIETFIAGRKTGKFREGDEEIDLLVKGEASLFPHQESLKKAYIVIPGLGATTVESVARLDNTTGPTQINHRERKRAITITVYPPEEKPLEEAINQVKAEVIAPITKNLSADYSIDVTGTASDLERAWKAFWPSFLLALAITYLLMASLFESFFYPLIIIVSVPLAVSGGVWAVAWANVPMDMLTLLGFIILCGVVVNNAILVVHQAMNFEQSGMEPQEAIRESVRSRLRPIFMSTITTTLGMLPMCIKGAPGSELYNGLAIAINGGLIFSTIFTLILIPALMSLMAELRLILIPALMSLMAELRKRKT